MLSRIAAEEMEAQQLAPYAMKSRDSEGRHYTEEPDLYRTAFQRDRDRIIHSSAFRRLEYKTQVFVYHEGDHYRTRLTHTLEGSQIARSLARMLRLNEELSEAIILAHDLGHTPFGHSGEVVMNRLMKNHGGFEHNRQSLRIVTELEERYPHFPGLNLTYEVREGMAKHETSYDSPAMKDLHKKGRPTLEAQLVNLADEIAYCNHDLDDGIQSGLLTLTQLSEVALWKEHFEAVAKNTPSPKIAARQTVRSIINHYVHDCAETTESRIKQFKIDSVKAVRQAGEPIAQYSEGLMKKNQELKIFLMRQMYRHPHVSKMAAHAEEVIEFLFALYLKNPKRLPESVQKKMKEEKSERVVCDYIAGMTDRFALEEYEKLN